MPRFSRLLEVGLHVLVKQILEFNHHLDRRYPILGECLFHLILVKVQTVPPPSLDSFINNPTNRSIEYLAAI